MFKIQWWDAMGGADNQGTLVNHGRFSDQEEQQAIETARQIYEMRPESYPRGIAVKNWQDRTVWSIGAAPTFKVQVWHARRKAWLDMLGSNMSGQTKDAAETGCTALDKIARHAFEMGSDKEQLRYRVMKEVYPMELIQGRPVSLARPSRPIQVVHLSARAS